MPEQLDANAITTLALFREGGSYRIPADTGLGGVYRPFARGERGGRTATLETLYDYWINDVPDPDEAMALDPGILQKIRFHPDVAAAFRKRELTVAGLPDRIEPNPDAPDHTFAAKVAEYVDWAFRAMGNIPKLYQMMQGAVIDGGRGIEFMWHREASGVERPVGFYPVHKTRFLFDRLGNLALRTRSEPVWGAYVEPTPGTYVAQELARIPGKFLYHTHRHEPGTWYQTGLEGYIYWGTGEDIALYYVVTFDIFVLKFRMKWLEKFGMPPLEVYYPENMPQYLPMIKRIADSCRGESIVTIPRPMGTGKENDLFKVVQREVPNSSYDHFETFANWTEKRVGKVLLGSAEENEKGEHGGYSDHMSRQDSGPQILFRWDAKNISATLQSQLIPAIARGRFPGLPDIYLPQHFLEPKEERDRDQEMKIVESASKLVPVPEDYVYEASGIRKPAPGEKTVNNPGEQQDPFGMGAGAAPPQMKPQAPPGMQPGRLGPPTPPIFKPGQGDNPQQGVDGAKQRAKAAISATIPGQRPQMKPVTPIGQGRGRDRTYSGRGR